MTTDTPPAAPVPAAPAPLAALPVLSLLRAGLLALLLTGAFVGGWERYWRGQGYPIAYNDDDGLWAHQRQRIYQSSPAGPVLIGSSRIKFDLDLATWAGISGQVPVQLALVGTSPRPVLTDLGNDPRFKGTLIVDVTEGLFFAPPGAPQERRAHERLKAYPKWSLAQQLSFWLNRGLESRLVLLDEEGLTVNAFLKLLPLPNRPGVFAFPNFPPRFAYNTFERQSRMTAEFVASPAMQGQMKAVWRKLGAADRKRGAGGDTLRAQLQAVKHAVDQIRSRGGQVLFIRCPSDGEFMKAENRCYPRALYWDRLLATTHAPGIYFADYPALAGFHCPEWSHLTARDAAAFTRRLVPIVEQQTGWAVAQASPHPLTPASAPGR